MTVRHPGGKAVAFALILFAAHAGSLTASEPDPVEPPPESITVLEEPVRYLSGADTVRAVLYRPDTDEALPGVVVIHEWYGLNTWIREQARRIAEQGYVALAIDLYRGEVATDAEGAHELMRGVPEDRASRDLQMAVEYLRSRREVTKDRVGSVGWCMGGGYSLQTALVVPDLAACVICYGRLVTEDESISAIGAPILGIFGAADRGIPGESVTKFEDQASKLGKQASMHLYEDAGHAFMRESNKDGYRAEATADAWQKIFAFLDTHLKTAAEE